MTIAYVCSLCGQSVEMNLETGRQIMQTSVPYVCPSCRVSSACRVYTDGPYLVTNGPEDVLHTFAVRIGLRRSMYQGTHYLIKSRTILIRALGAGAVRVGTDELRAILAGAGKPAIRRSVA